MIVDVHWKVIRGMRDPAWRWSRVLYAYLDVDLEEILYIGKADGTTVRQRWHRTAKANFWDDLEHERGIKKHVVIVGDVHMEPGLRLTRELLADIESLLIKRIRPWGNIQATRSRIRRPGLRVTCKGGWKNWRSEYRDV